MNSDLLAELARRELARRYYSEYLAYSYGPSWIRTRLSSYLAQRIQNFIETDTGHAYDILIIECPPQHGKSMTVSESLPSWYLGKTRRETSFWHPMIQTLPKGSAGRTRKRSRMWAGICSGLKLVQSIVPENLSSPMAREE